MKDTQTLVETTLRIPGNWADTEELIDQLPEGYQLTTESLVLPDGTELWFSMKRRDNEFAHIFRTACRQPATEKELAIVDNYTFNAILIGPGGSMEGALRIMEAGAAIVRAGAAGVFIDNSAMAHGGSNWIEMTEDASPDAISFAFVTILRGKQDVRTIGMHVLGLPEAVMNWDDAEDWSIVELIRYMAASDTPIGHGHVIADEDGPRFQAVVEPASRFDTSSRMHNPFGNLRLVSFKNIADTN